MIGDRIKTLRDNADISQAELARTLGISRASVNAWEQGFSAPQAAYIVEMAKFFHCTADYILELDDAETIDISELDRNESAVMYKLMDCFGHKAHIASKKNTKK